MGLFAPLVNPRIALVGCGAVGEIHRERLLDAGVEVVALCDPNSEALAALTERLPHRPRLFRSMDDLLDAEVCDAVILCTPHGLHAAQTEAAIDKGVHVLCEKPFVTQSARAKELLEKARAKNLLLFVAYTRRGRGHVNYLLQAAKKIAPLNNVLILRSQPWFQTYGLNWRMNENEGGGFLRDAGASMLDFLLHVAETPLTHSEAHLFRRPGAEMDVRASVRLDFLGNLRGEITLIGDATETFEQILLFGENGMAGWAFAEQGPKVLFLHPEGEPRQEETHPIKYRTLSPDQAFLAALRSGGDDTSPEVSRYEALSALPVIELVERLYLGAYWR
jgi:predicted dehydrogenase